MPKSPFVSPDTSIAPLVEIEELLKGRGIAGPSARGVAELFLVAHGELAGDGAPVDFEDFESLLVDLASRVRSYGEAQPSDELALLAATHFLSTTAFQYRGWRGDATALIARMATFLAERHEAYSAALATVFASRSYARGEVQRTGLLTALLARGLVDPRWFVDAGTIRQTTKGAPGISWNQQDRDQSPSLPDFWVLADPPSAMAAFTVMVDEEPIETLAQLVLGLERSLDLRYPADSQHLYPMLVPIAKTLCRRRREEGREQDPMLTRACWAFTRWACEANPENLVAERTALRELALAELGRIRSWLRDESGAGAERFAERRDYLQTGLFFVLRTDASSLWDVLRRLLLAFRETKHRAVPLDLRSWDEGDLDPMPQPWGWIPDHIARALELFLGRELERDPSLEQLRFNLAQFCLDRLKTKKRMPKEAVVTVADLVEPEAVWRAGYLHAVAELHVNPRGEGHEVLRWSADHDPSDLVRDGAKAAHTALRRGHKLPPGVSPRRAIFAAIWWLKQAHVLSLKAQPDPVGAQRTHRKEARRAREQDERMEETRRAQGLDRTPA